MKKQKILYAITIEDVMRVAKEERLSFSEKDLQFIEEKTGDFIGDKWYDAVLYALKELQRNK